MNTFQVSHFMVDQIIAVIQLIVDFGLVILIWMVQLIVYPSFKYYKEKNLIVWHQKYTPRIAIIVVPLMLIQLAIAVFNIFYQFSSQVLINFIIVLILWIFTFTSFAPLHFKISEGRYDEKLITLLIKRNWMRTFLWTFLFVSNVMYSIPFFTINL